MQNGRFRQKVHLKKVYSKSLCVIYCQRRSCKAFTGLSFHAKMACGGHPFLREKLAESDPLLLKTPISNQYSLASPQL